MAYANRVIILLLLQFCSGWSVAAVLSLPKAEHQQLVIIEKMIKAQDDAKAVSALKAFNTKKHSAYAKSLSLQMLAGLYQKQALYSQAVTAYSSALTFKALPLKTRLTLSGKVYRMNYQLKDWKNTVLWWDKWQSARFKGRGKSWLKPLNSEDYLLVTTAYQHLEKWSLARKTMRLAIATHANPPPSLFRVQWLIEQNIGQGKQQIALLEQLILRFPQDENYWLRLAKIHDASKQYQRSAAVLQSAFAAGALVTPAHIQWMASQLAKVSNPATAALLLQEAIAQHKLADNADNWRKVAQYHIQAKAFSSALLALQKSQRLIQQGNNYLLLSQLQYQLEHWQEAIEDALKLDVEQRSNNAKLQLIMAESSLRLKDIEAAEQHFARVLAIEPDNSIAVQRIKQLAKLN